MAMTIPEVRARLYVLAEELNCPELKRLADATRRRFFGRVAPSRQVVITRFIVDKVRATAAKHPKMHQRVIGQRFGIDQGRVNEILHGYRDGSSYESRHDL